MITPEDMNFGALHQTVVAVKHDETLTSIEFDGTRVYIGDRLPYVFAKEQFVVARALLYRGIEQPDTTISVNKVFPIELPRPVVVHTAYVHIGKIFMKPLGYNPLTLVTEDPSGLHRLPMLYAFSFDTHLPVKTCSASKNVKERQLTAPATAVEEVIQSSPSDIILALLRSNEGVELPISEIKKRYQGKSGAHLSDDDFFMIVKQTIGEYRTRPRQSARIIMRMVDINAEEPVILWQNLRRTSIMTGNEQI